MLLRRSTTQKKVPRVMNTRPLRKKFRSRVSQSIVAVLCALSLAPGDTAVCVQPMMPQNVSTDQVPPKISDGQLDSLVAPIALYPDPLLSQVLVASTYPLEIIQLQQWLERNKDLKGDALMAAVEKEDWDPSIQAMAALPDAVKRLAGDIKWTTDLGNAFLAQQDDVMDAVQRMRAKALSAGNLQSNEQMKVETKVVETKTIVIVQQTNPQVVYVPWYSPVVVYGPPVYLYPYPPIYYPPPNYYAAGVVIGFGVGVAVGAYYRGGWGYYPGWGRHTTININVNNRYVSHYNRTNINVNRTNINTVNRNVSTWQHNPQHRGGTPYPNKQVATTYGGTARGDSAATRQANARQQQGAGNRPQPSATNRQQAGTNNRAGSNSGARPSNAGAGATNQAASSSAARSSNANANRSSNGNNIGNRQIPSNDASRNTSAFGGASSKASAQAASARGASSLGTSRGGGARSSGGAAARKS